MSKRTAKKLFATPPEIAVEVGVRPETVVGWIRSGELRAVDLSRPDARKPRFKIRRADLEGFLARRDALRRDSTGHAGKGGNHDLPE